MTREDVVVGELMHTIAQLHGRINDLAVAVVQLKEIAKAQELEITELKLPKVKVTKTK